jgi:hypothetical protein
MDNGDTIKKEEHRSAAWTQRINESRRLFLDYLLGAVLLIGVVVGRGLWKGIRPLEEANPDKLIKAKSHRFFKKIKKLSLDDLRNPHDLAG